MLRYPCSTVAMFSTLLWWDDRREKNGKERECAPEEGFGKHGAMKVRRQKKSMLQIVHR